MQAGAIHAGVLGGAQLHLCNFLTALYLALGQAPAAATENAIGYTDCSFKETEQDQALHCSLTLPSLTIGTVGGATRLPHACQNLALLDCLGANHCCL